MRCFAFAEYVLTSSQLSYKDFFLFKSVNVLTSLPQNTSITNSVAVFFRDISSRNQHIDIFFGVFCLGILVFLIFFKKHRNHKKNFNVEIIKLRAENEFLNRSADLRFGYQNSLMQSLFEAECVGHSPEVNMALVSIKSRISDLGKIHNELTRRFNQSQLHMKDYISMFEDFVNEKSNSAELRFNVNHNPKLEVEKLAFIGLIVHELMTSALSHQPIGEERLKVNVNVKQEAGKLAIDVRDNGHKDYSEIDFKNAPSLGLKMAMELSKQIEASVYYVHSKIGTHYQLQIPN